MSYLLRVVNREHSNHGGSDVDGNDNGYGELFETRVHAEPGYLACHSTSSINGWSGLQTFTTDAQQAIPFFPFSVIFCNMQEHTVILDTSPNMQGDLSINKGLGQLTLHALEYTDLQIDILLFLYLPFHDYLFQPCSYFSLAHLFS